MNGFNYSENGSTIISLPLLTTVSSFFNCAINPNLISISFPALTTITGTFVLNFNPLLNSISLPVLTSYSGLDFSASNSALPSSKINQFLAKLVAIGVTGTTIDLSSQTPSAPPSGSGITDKASLISAGNTVLTD